MYDATLMDTNLNADLAEKVLGSGNHSALVLTYLPNSGWIHKGQMDSEGYIDNASRLMNVDKYREMKKVGAAAGIESSDIFTQHYQTILEGAQQAQDKIDNNPYIKPAYLVGAAATGNNLIETPYETVRKVNYLSGVVSKEYDLADFNATQMLNERRVNVLNVVGFKKTSALLEGIPEIGDHTTPPPSKQTFGTYNKSLYADSFRYEFGMREKKDSVFNLVQQIRAEIPGVFAKMKDDKAITLLNAVSSSALSTTWDAKGSTAGFYDTDAIADVETIEDILNAYPAAQMHFIAPRAVVRSYKRNIQEVGVGSVERSPNSFVPPGRRNGILDGNTEVTYHINQGVTAKTFVMSARESWADLLRGPVVTVSYKNELTPAQTEGTIQFDFNGVMEKDSGAVTKRTSVLT